jgi:hypothetical protein
MSEFKGHTCIIASRPAYLRIPRNDMPALHICNLYRLETFTSLKERKKGGYRPMGHRVEWASNWNISTNSMSNSKAQADLFNEKAKAHSYHRWASTSILMSAISDIRHRHLLFRYRKKICRSFRYQKSSNIDIWVHFDIRYLKSTFHIRRILTQEPCFHRLAPYLSATTLI